MLLNLIAGCCVFVVIGCSTAPLHRQPRAPLPPPVPLPTPDEASPAPDIKSRNSRALAALTLSEQAKALLDQNQPDQAIRLLERAINLHPQQGEPYYYLADAWLQKGDFDQAREFNRLAEIYFKDDDSWRQRIALQKIRIHQLQP